MKPTLYAQRDPVEIEGKFYKLGEPIDADHNPNALNVLEQQGIVSANAPVVAVSIPVEEKAVDDMNRTELEFAVMSRTKDAIATRSDDELRAAINRMSADDDNGAGDGSTGGTPYADLKDKPLGTLKTAELDTIAREEGISFEGAKNNPDRVKAIEEHREKVKAG